VPRRRRARQRGHGRATATGVAFDAFELLLPFESEHNAKDHVGPPAAADERLAGHAVGQAGLGGPAARRHRGVARRARHEPGTVYTYNDVRVNLLALAALNVWRGRCRRCCAST
jgi:hypothetical protein